MTAKYWYEHGFEDGRISCRWCCFAAAMFAGAALWFGGISLLRWLLT